MPLPLLVVPAILGGGFFVLRETNTLLKNTVKIVVVGGVIYLTYKFYKNR